jgi:hypothetical protein
MPIAEKPHRLRARAQAIAIKDASKAETCVWQG